MTFYTPQQALDILLSGIFILVALMLIMRYLIILPAHKRKMRLNFAQALFQAAQNSGMQLSIVNVAAPSHRFGHAKLIKHLTINGVEWASPNPQDMDPCIREMSPEFMAIYAKLKHHPLHSFWGTYKTLHYQFAYNELLKIVENQPIPPNRRLTQAP